jgi:hypothetical protein
MKNNVQIKEFVYNIYNIINNEYIQLAYLNNIDLIITEINKSIIKICNIKNYNRKPISDLMRLNKIVFNLYVIIYISIGNIIIDTNNYNNYTNSLKYIKNIFDTYFSSKSIPLIENNLFEFY